MTVEDLTRHTTSMIILKTTYRGLLGRQDVTKAYKKGLDFKLDGATVLSITPIQNLPSASLALLVEI